MAPPPRAEPGGEAARRAGILGLLRFLLRVAGFVDFWAKWFVIKEALAAGIRVVGGDRRGVFDYRRLLLPAHRQAHVLR